MPRPSRFHIWLPSLLLLHLTGCNLYLSSGETPDQPQTDLALASSMRPCGTNSSQLCWLQRLDDGSTWSERFEPIQGFNYQWGHSYRLRISGDPYGLPGSRSRLVGIEQEQSDPVGREYWFNNITLADGSFSGNSNSDFRFYQQRFVCAPQVNCLGLVAMSGSQGIVSLRFRYTGNEQTPIELIWWN